MGLALIALAGVLVADRPAALVPNPAMQGAYRQELTRQAIAAEAYYALKPACRAAEVSDRALRLLLLPRAHGRPAVGAVEQVRFDGCGRQGLVNLEAFWEAELGRWRFVRRLPGESRADAELQRETLEEGLKRATKDAPDCEPELGLTVAVGQSRIQAAKGGVTILAAGDPPPLQRRGARSQTTVVRLSDPALPARVDAAASWVESWPVTVCGRARALTILFAPLKGEPGQYLTDIAVADGTP